jgi:hypothetical protein
MSLLIQHNQITPEKTKTYILFAAHFIKWLTPCLFGICSGYLWMTPLPKFAVQLAIRRFAHALPTPFRFPSPVQHPTICANPSLGPGRHRHGRGLSDSQGQYNQTGRD